MKEPNRPDRPIARSSPLVFVLVFALLAALLGLVPSNSPPVPYRDLQDGIPHVPDSPSIDGSLPVKNGEVVVEGNNWIVSDLSRYTPPRYYKLGEVTPIEGFTADPAQTIKTDTNEKDFWFVPGDVNSRITQYYVAGVADSPAAMASSVQPYFISLYGEEDISDVMTATVGGHEAAYFSAVTVDTTAKPESTTQMLCLYLPALRNTSILVSVTLQVTEDMPPLTNSELLALADSIVRGITIEPSE